MGTGRSRCRTMPLPITLGSFTSAESVAERVRMAKVTSQLKRVDTFMGVERKGLVILFAGALENLFRPQLELFVKRLSSVDS